MRSALSIALFLSCQTAYPFAAATATSWSTETAIDTMKQGGNAVDAAVAASFMLNVALPDAMGIGGGGFLLVARNGKSQFWDSRETAPASAHAKMFLDPSGKPIHFYPERVTGPNGVGVPGMILGLYEAHRKYGKLPWKRLLAPAIRAANSGIPVTPKFEELLKNDWDRLKNFPASAATFGNKEGSYLKTGTVMRNPVLAQTLEKIARDPRSFYNGELARSWIYEAQRLGVKITTADLAAYKVKERAPVSFKVFDLRGITAPPPSGGGIMVAATLRYLDRYYRVHEVPPVDSAERVIVTTEALRHFQKLRNDKIADPPANQLDPQKFLESPEEKAAWAEIDRAIEKHLEPIQTKVTGSSPGGFPPAPTRFFGHTSHLSVVDDHGMAVAYTTTLEELFGSAMVVPAHGFVLNNELTDFSAEPDTHPNAAAPGKRPRSNMSPTLLYDASGGLVGAVGSAGGPRIPTAIVELLENYFLHKMPARQAIAFPRFHFDNDTLYVEAAMPSTTLQRLKEAGYNVQIGQAWSSAQAVLRRSSKSTWEAAGEPRGDGLGLSF